MTQDKFDSWLAQRPMEEPSSDLTSRISAMATQIPQQSESWWKGFAMPMPAYAFASLLVLGGIFVLPMSHSAPDSVSDEELFSEVFYYPDDTLF
ncbi:MAG: hypothetical protein P8P30_03790 [Rickettsiales bacterium]|nr:hypothetical protein [Rickettsiales bacterium]